jgi:oxygen-independent coproporphyrinogen-3 oxidase
MVTAESTPERTLIPLGFYIHIPFCVRKCLYCDFVSYAGKEHLVQAYFEALRREWKWYRHYDLLSEYKLYTLYVGGGNPSLVTEELAAFFQAYHEMLPLERFHEVTIEVNPGTISFSQLQRLYRAGFNRVSIGVQSFHDEELSTLGRIHTRAEALACFHAARRAGFRNISLDLIFGIPGSTLETWESTLHETLALQPEHISTYNLTIEAGTPFWELHQQGKLKLPDEDLQLNLYQSGIATLNRAGYEQYEISNFALPGYRCWHNQIYWHNEEYLGLGAGAHSYLKGYRYWNHADLETYIDRSAKTSVWRPKQRFGTPGTVEGAERLDLSGTIGETVIMNLRMLEGIDMTAFQQRFGQSFEVLFAKPLDKLLALNLLEFSGTRLRLTPKGIHLSNEVFREFINNEQ